MNRILVTHFTTWDNILDKRIDMEPDRESNNPIATSTVMKLLDELEGNYTFDTQRARLGNCYLGGCYTG